MKKKNMQKEEGLNDKVLHPELIKNLKIKIAKEISHIFK